MAHSKIQVLIQKVLNFDLWKFNIEVEPLQVLDQSRRSCKVWQVTFALQIMDRSPAELGVQSALHTLKYVVVTSVSP